jgi:hypothetical protein
MLFGRGERGRVAVEGQNESGVAAGCEPFRDQSRVSAAAESSINDDLPWPRIEPLQDFGGQNGNVDWSNGHDVRG